MKNKICSTFNLKFCFLKDKFEFNNIKFEKDSRKQDKEIINRPGVYIICSDKKILKVGRHFRNAKKRAYEHFRDNTQNINDYNKDEIKIFLFNTKNDDDNFWIASLEIFLEAELKPIIKSKRIG